MNNVQVDINEIWDILKGFFEKIENKIPNYEQRKSQKKMIQTIVQSFLSEHHALIEAPTGTGKSMGYLLAFLAVLEYYKKIQKEDLEIETPVLVVSTNTIALQGQLLEKDIPTLKRVLGLDFTATLVKGRENYLCLHRYDSVVNHGFKDIEDAMLFTELQKEILKGNDKPQVGSKSDLNKEYKYSLWGEINCQSDKCTKKRCPHFENCFYYNSKKMASKSDILVVNHALFFTNLKLQIDTGVDNLVLPSYDYVVFDEAHHIESAASERLAERTSYFSILKLYSEIKNQITKRDLSEYLEENINLREDFSGEIEIAKVKLEDFYKKIALYMSEAKENVLYTRRLLINDKDFIDTNEIKEINKVLISFLHKIEDSFDLSEEDTTLVESFISRLEHSTDIIETVVSQNENNSVYWLEMNTKEEKHKFISFNYSPITVNEVLSKNLFEVNKSIVLTSATLATENMEYIASRLGLDIQNCFWNILDSPFNYYEQSMLYIPNVNIDPKNLQYETFLENEIINLIEKAQGRTLVLFTSYQTLNNVYKNIHKRIKYPILKQGDGTREILLKEFKDKVSSVLFATSSFWEGIDIQGESLSCVIITRLPFEVPNQPIIEARIEKIQNEGGFPFVEYSVPVAIMKFKQGVGRLIRSKSDKGIIAILDNRIIQKSYGKTFLNSIHKMPITQNIEDVSKVL